MADLQRYRKRLLFESSINEEAHKWLGVRYKHMGRDINGVDCLGLIYCIYSNLKFDVPKLDDFYVSKWYLGDPMKLHRGLHRYAYPVKGSRQIGDVCVFKFINVAATHLGLWLSDTKFIHSINLGINKVIISDFYDRAWKRSYIGSYRPKFLEV